MRAIVFAVALVAGCGFQPSGLGPTDDATAADARPIDATPDDGRPPIDAPVIDAPIDAPAIDAPDLLCPSGYAPIGLSASRYRKVDTTATWAAAAADCNNDDDTGGTFSGSTHLVVFSSEAERLAVTAALGAGNGNTWIGLSDEENEGTWEWVTAEPTGGYPGLARPPWDSSEPNGGDNDDCVRMKNSFLFDDKACSDANNDYLCECDPFPPL